MGSDGYAERVVERLREEGLKVTPQRLAVVRYLDGNPDHPSVEQIHREVTRSFPTISLATIYNTLDVLERIDAVQSVFVDSGRRRYDPETRPHHHVVCRRCLRVADVLPDDAGPIPVPGSIRDRFADLQTVVLYRGVCPACQTPAV